MQSDSLKMHRLCWRAQTGFHRPLKHAKHPGTNADVAELVDARDLKSLDGNVVWVRVPPPAPVASARFRLRWACARTWMPAQAVTPVSRIVRSYHATRATS